MGWASDGSGWGEEAIQSIGHHKVNYQGKIDPIETNTTDAEFLFPMEH